VRIALQLSAKVAETPARGWTHVAVTGHRRRFTLYVNGKEVASKERHAAPLRFHHRSPCPA
jgi:hypothetical protein